MKSAVVVVLMFLVGIGGMYAYLARARSAGAAHAPTASLLCATHQVTESECPFCHPELVEAMGPCAEHGIPEALCVPCRPMLEAAFRAEGDWCAGHGVPESQCVPCGGGALCADAPASPAPTAPDEEVCTKSCCAGENAEPAPPQAQEPAPDGK